MLSCGGHFAAMREDTAAAIRTAEPKDRSIIIFKFLIKASKLKEYNVKKLSPNRHSQFEQLNNAKSFHSNQRDSNQDSKGSQYREVRKDVILGQWLEI